MTGIRQRQLLELMWREGGIYPPDWRMTSHRKQMLERMVELGWLYKARNRAGQMVYRMTAMRQPDTDEADITTALQALGVTDEDH